MIIKNYLSIICPVYNCEQFLSELLSVLARQTRGDFQLIMIDDCSNDNSYQVIQSFKQYFDEITILHNEKNKGVSYSRNLGLEHITGEYVAFIDADDLVEDNYVESIYSGINSIYNDWDLIYFPVKSFSNSRNSTIDILLRDKIIYSKSKIIKYILDVRYLGGYLFNKIFKSQRLYDIHFDEKITVSEDELFCLQYVMKNEVECVYFIDNVYYYRQHVNSTTKSLNSKKLSDMYLARANIAEILCSTSVKKLANAYVFFAKIYTSFYLPSWKINKFKLIKHFACLFYKHIKTNDKLCYCLYLINYKLAQKIYFKRNNQS